MRGISDGDERRLRAWADGKGGPPWWVEPLLMAEAWRLPPWTVIEHAPTEWVDRWRALEVLRHDQQAVASGEAKAVGGRVYRKVQKP